MILVKMAITVILRAVSAARDDAVLVSAACWVWLAVSGDHPGGFKIFFPV